MVFVNSCKCKDTDKKKGVKATLENALGSLENCDFGLWGNGSTYNLYISNKKEQ